MAKLVILGTSNAVPDEDHENTHMVVVGQERTLLIDCVHNALVRLRKAGVDHNQVTDMVLTHFHPDHVSGVPSLLMDSWLLGRKNPLTIYGLAHTLDRMEALMDAYDWKSWPHFFPVTFIRLPEAEMTLVMDHPEFRVFASPVQHMIPNIGLRVEFPFSGRSMAYSCDTEPTQRVVRLGRDVDVLIHEATGEGKGHSSAAQAGEIARAAGAKSLMLIHYRTGGYDHGPLLEQAQDSFPGPVTLATDFMSIDF